MENFILKSYYPTIFLFLLLVSCAAPKAKFSFEADQSQAPANVQFQNQSVKAERYFWNFGDGDTTSLQDPEHRFLTSGRYTVKLQAIKGKKINTNQKDIIVKAPEKCLVELETQFGNMLIELYDETPKHRDNFFKLAEEGYYNGLLFHRVISGFMIQGGDPQSRETGQGQPLGSGGPGYTIAAEFNDALLHVKGALAAARMGDNVNPEKESSGSQFYIVQGNQVTKDQLGQVGMRNGIEYTEDQIALYEKIGGTPFLDGSYTVFGRVIEGLDVIDKISSVMTDNRDRPQEDVSMKLRVIK
jgi:peptidyl-prolyl cis-trans isomerase B (cyclophilin B)